MSVIRDLYTHEASFPCGGEGDSFYKPKFMTVSDVLGPVGIQPENPISTGVFENHR